MTSSSNLPNGTTSYTSTLAVGVADQVQFPDRYGYVTVTNESTSGVLAVRTDGQPATETSEVPGVNCYAVMPGEVLLLANGLQTWYQTSKVIQKGSIQFGGGNTASSPASPGMVTPQGSLAGGAQNPGTSVSLISGAAVQYTVAASG